VGGVRWGLAFGPSDPFPFGLALDPPGPFGRLLLGLRTLEPARGRRGPERPARFDRRRGKHTLAN